MATITGGTLAVSALNRPAANRHPATTPTTAAATAEPTAELRCQVSRLPTNGVKKAVVTGGDPSGHYLIGRTYPTGSTESSRPIVIWRDGKIYATVRIPGDDGDFDDINSHGVAIGSSFLTEDTEVSWVSTRGGTPTRLPGAGTAAAINDAGVIAGVAGSHPVRWKSATTQPVRLALPAGATEGRALDIAEDGTVLGEVGTVRRTTGYLWSPSGVGRKMPPPPDVFGKPATGFWPVAIRGNWVTGRAVRETTHTTDFAGYRYRLDTNTYQALPADAQIPARIAENGWVAAVVGRPTLYDDKNRTTTLPVPKSDKGSDFDIANLSDDGRILGGYSIPAEGLENHPLLWHCS